MRIRHGNLSFNPWRDVGLVFKKLLQQLETQLAADPHEVRRLFPVRPSNDELWEAAHAYSQLYRLAMSSGQSMTIEEAYQASGLAALTPAARLAATYYLGAMFAGTAVLGLRETYGGNTSVAAYDLREIVQGGVELQHLMNLGRWRWWLYRRFEFFRRRWAPPRVDLFDISHYLAPQGDANCLSAKTGTGSSSDGEASRSPTTT